MVGVQVREEDLVEIGQADRAQQLALGALTAVDQDAVASPADQERGQAPALRGQRAAGAREEDREFHRSASVPAGAGDRGLASPSQGGRRRTPAARTAIRWQRAAAEPSRSGGFRYRSLPLWLQWVLPFGVARPLVVALVLFVNHQTNTCR